MSTTTPLSTTVSAVIETAVQFDDFDLLEVLGVGTWGKVFRVRNKQTGKISALKVIASELLTSEDEDKVMAELQALRRLVGVPGFLQLEASFHNSMNYCILTVRLRP
jgi:serine/threonine protein kinase